MLMLSLTIDLTVARYTKLHICILSFVLPTSLRFSYAFLSAFRKSYLLLLEVFKPIQTSLQAIPTWSREALDLHISLVSELNDHLITVAQ